jgi:hypothetical protein
MRIHFQHNSVWPSGSKDVGCRYSYPMDVVSLQNVPQEA